MPNAPLRPMRVPIDARHLVEMGRSHDAPASPSKWAIIGEQRSDDLGNVYYRLATEDDRIHRLTPSGVDETILLDSGAQDIVVSPDGTLYELGNSKQESWISEFNHSGVKGPTVILRPRSDDISIAGLRLARFSSGRFLVVGYQFFKETRKASPLIAVFDEDGFHVADVHLPADAQGNRFGIRATRGFLDAASLGAAAIDSQGDHVYLVVPGVDGPLLTIESSGAISNVFPIAAAKNGVRLTSFRVRSDKVVLALRGDTTLPDGKRTVAVVYKVFDLRLRKLLSSFHEENFSGDIVSYNGAEEFTNFVSLPNRKYLSHVAGGGKR